MNDESAAAAAAVLINAAFMGANLAVHRWESRRAWFVERRRELGSPRLLGPFGYYSGRYGNTVAVTAINVGVALAVLGQLRFEPWMLVCALAGPIVAAGYFFHCNRVRKIDWTFLGDRITLGGQLHLVYVAVEVGAGALGIGLAAANGLNPHLLTAVSGGALYLCLVGLDIRSGNHRRPRRPA